MRKKILEEIERMDWDPFNLREKFIQGLKRKKILRDEGTNRHYCAFFLPYDPVAKKVFLGHHKKADLWISPGGHIDLGESPPETVIRELKEELGIDYQGEVEPIMLGETIIENPRVECKYHYDLWYGVEIEEQELDWDKREFYDARWLSWQEAVERVSRQDNLLVIKKLLSGHSYKGAQKRGRES